MQTISGTMSGLSVKPMNTKYGERVKIGVCVDTGGEEAWYNGLDQPDGPLVTSLQSAAKGQPISFLVEEKNGYVNIKKVLSVATTPAPPAAPSKPTAPVRGGNAAFNRFAGDNDEKQRSIVFQSCLKVAGHLVASGLQANVLPLGQKKADKWDDVQEILLKLAERLAYEVGERSKQPFKSPDAEAEELVDIEDSDTTPDPFDDDI